MINAIIGNINNEVVLSFNLEVEGPGGGDASKLDPKKRACIIKDSKALEKGLFVPFAEDENPNNTEYRVEYTDMTSKIRVILTPSKIHSKIKIYSKLPTPERYQISEFFVEGNFSIEKINVEPAKKTIKGDEFLTKLEDNKTLSIDHKVFFEVTGPPLIKQDSIQSKLGEIKIIRPKLEVEI
jgi:hypothetical protein